MAQGVIKHVILQVVLPYSHLRKQNVHLLCWSKAILQPEIGNSLKWPSYQQSKGADNKQCGSKARYTIQERDTIFLPKTDHNILRRRHLNFRQDYFTQDDHLTAATRTALAARHWIHKRLWKTFEVLLWQNHCSVTKRDHFELFLKLWFKMERTCCLVNCVN